MSDRIVLFPFAKSPGVVRRFADAQARLDGEIEVQLEWRRGATALAESLIGAVPNAEINSELFRLLDASAFIANRRRADRQRAAAHRADVRIRVVEPAQGDLFATPAAASVVRMEGEADAIA